MDRGPGRRLRAAILWVLVAPFLALSLVPEGVMPARAAGGALTLVLCTADGPVEQVIDLAAGAPADRAPADGRGCDWACGQCAAAPAQPPASAPAVVLGESRRDPPPAPMILNAAEATGLPPSTGPPASV